MTGQLGMGLAEMDPKWNGVIPDLVCGVWWMCKEQQWGARRGLS